jgi:hypothetical protein
LQSLLASIIGNSKSDTELQPNFGRVTNTRPDYLRSQGDAPEDEVGSEAERFNAAVEGETPDDPEFADLIKFVRRLQSVADIATPEAMMDQRDDIVAAFARTTKEQDSARVDYTPSGEVVQHGGSGAAYVHHGCRCDECTAANTARAQRRRLERKGLTPHQDSHGRFSTYVNWWCRCLLCRRAAELARRIMKLSRET